MFAKIVVVACIQLALLDVIASNCIRSVLPNCGCGGIELLPSQCCCNQPGFAIVNGQFSLPGSTNIIQDNSVANNLANTLQLLLVSNLLSNTLPNSPELIVPGCPCSPCSPCGGFSYIL